MDPRVDPSPACEPPHPLALRAAPPALGGLRGARTGLRGALRAVGRGSRFAAAVAVFYAVFFNLSVVRGNSMSPSIFDGDRILVEPWSYVFGGIERGDVVVLQYPLDPSVDYIKRVIGLPGDTVTLAGGHVWVNGELLHEPYIASGDPDSYLTTRVKDGQYFVLGDNRPRSSDSREFGQVPAEYVRGRVDLRLWPLGRLGFIR
ncbi:MAG: signal peptidase I [Planctomycetota bacterium]